MDIAIISVIGVNVLAIVIETLPWVTPGLKRVLYVLEAVSVVLFTVEYLLRLWTARYRRPGQGGLARRAALRGLAGRADRPAGDRPVLPAVP